MSAIKLPGGMALGMASAVAQNDEKYGGSTRLRAQVTVVASAVGIAIGYAAISSGGAFLLVMSGALTIAAAPVAATLSIVYLAQAGNTQQTEAYRNAMDVVGVTSSLGALIGFTTHAAFTRDSEGALKFSKGAGLVERLASIEKVVGLAGGYEMGSIAVEGGNFVAELLEDVAPTNVRRPDPHPPKARPIPLPGREQNGDRNTNGQQHAERNQQAREREQEREQAKREEVRQPEGKPGPAQGKPPNSGNPKPGGGSISKPPKNPPKKPSIIA